MSVDVPWWRKGVIYNAYPRSWYDGDGDGDGDLRGVIERLDYLVWLGIDGLWLNPIMPSPNFDWGYDVTDYRAIHPHFGTLASFDELVAEAATRGIDIVFDIVLSHTSDRHPWFVEARRSRTSRYRDYYVWRSSGPSGSRPNNWIGYFGEPAWTFDEATGEYYMHNFSQHQPQLNWWNPEVRAEFDEILRFWFDRGVAGLRIDALQALLYDPELRNNPRAGPGDTRKENRLDQRFMFNANRPEIHEVVRRWRRLADRYDPPRLLFGETWVPSIEQMAEYYGTGDDQLDLAWNVPFLQSSFNVEALRSVIERTLALIPPRAWPAWAASTHDDDGRAATRWCKGNPDAIRCALLLLLTIRGTPILYYGDEVGMVEPPPEEFRSAAPDPVADEGSRHASRTPMQWRPTPDGGFTTSSRPWLPIGDTRIANVESQRADPGSILSFTRDLLALRRRIPELSIGSMELIEGPPDVVAWRRGTNVLVALNLGPRARRIEFNGTLAIGTDRARDHEPVVGALTLRPFEGAIALRGSEATRRA